jgi:hypothetical protein
MAKITQFKGTNVKEFRHAIEKAIKDACDKMGVKAPTLGNCNFTPTSFSTAKLVFGIQAEPLSKDTPGLLNSTFRQGAGRFTVTQVNTDHVVATTSRGKRYTIRYDQLDNMAKV